MKKVYLKTNSKHVPLFGGRASNAPSTMADGSPDDSITERLQRLQDLLEDDQAQENEADFSAAALDPSISSSSAAAPGTRGVHISRTGSMEITRDGMPAGLVEGGAVGGTMRVRPSHVQIHRTGSLEIDLAPGSYSPEQQQQQQPRFSRTAPSALDSVLSAMPSASPAPTATTLTMLPGDEGGVASSTIDDRLKKLEQSLRDDVDDDPAGALGALGATDASMIMPFSPAASQNTSTSLVVPARAPGGSTPRGGRGGGGGRGGQGGRGEEKGVAGGAGGEDEDGEEGTVGSPKFGVSRLLQPGAKLVETRDSLRLTKRKQLAPELASPLGRGRGDGGRGDGDGAVEAILDSDSAAGALRLNQLTDTSIGGRQPGGRQPGGQPDLSAILPARVRQPVLDRRAGSPLLLELRWTARVRNPVDGEVIVTGFQAVYRRSVPPTAVGDEVRRRVTIIFSVAKYVH